MPAPIIVQVAPHANEPRLLTVEQVADALNCTTNHVGGWIRGGKLGAFNFASDLKTRAVFRIPPAAFQRFLQDAVVA